jgi:hypothetical protein
MKRLWVVGAAALALTIFQLGYASAQRGGLRAAGGSRGGAIGGGYRGVAMHGAAIRGGVWRSGSGGHPAPRWPVAIAAETWGYYNEPNNEQCVFLTHYGRTFSC